MWVEGACEGCVRSVSVVTVPCYRTPPPHLTDGRSSTFWGRARDTRSTCLPHTWPSPTSTRCFGTTTVRTRALYCCCFECNPPPPHGVTSHDPCCRLFVACQHFAACFCIVSDQITTLGCAATSRGTTTSPWSGADSICGATAVTPLGITSKMVPPVAHLLPPCVGLCGCPCPLRVACSPRSLSVLPVRVRALGARSNGSGGCPAAAVQGQHHVCWVLPHPAARLEPQCHRCSHRAGLICRHLLPPAPPHPLVEPGVGCIELWHLCRSAHG